ncbi:alpha-glucosidase [Fulvitalea axinellae]|uniref:Alpha-glucosidase n=2 Tax=Fulvitalea axinellae TaxID=1182444 RepID=A0AAU9CHS9_9BACT|nr:alpha-glucosidase [Fulvitalea axinellae]
MISALMVMVFFTACQQVQKTTKVESPGKKTTVSFRIRDGKLLYSALKDGDTVLRESALGLRLKGGGLERVRQLSQENSATDEKWDAPWGDFSKVRNHYNEIRLHLADESNPDLKLNVVARAYDNGIAVRYEFPRQGRKRFVVEKDLMEFDFADDVSCYAPNGERDPVGPVKVASIKSLKAPVVMESPKGKFFAVHEADLNDFSFMNFVRNKKGCLAVNIEASTVEAPKALPWRVVLMENSLGDLSTSHLIQNLNPARRIADASWVRAGTCTNECRYWGAKLEDGFRYGKNMETFKRMVDFSADNGVPYLMVDSGWYGNQWDAESDPLTERQDGDAKTAARFYNGDVQEINKLRGKIDMPGLVRYARERRVGVFIYLNDKLRRSKGMGYLEKVLATYHDWGAVGIKYGFMKEKNRQKKVRLTREIVEMCAKYKLMVNFHDNPIHPTGEDRTWPNLVTREFGHAQFDAGRTFSPTGFLKTIFVNSVAGPVDFQNGFFSLESEMVAERFQVRKPLYSTAVAEAARVLVGSVGLTIISDHDNAYESKQDLFDFVKEMKGSWDETRVLTSEMGSKAVYARRRGENWYVGGLVNEKGGDLRIPLGFLKSGKKYEATVFEDGSDTDFERNQESYEVSKKVVSAEDVLDFQLSNGGGVCVSFKEM